MKSLFLATILGIGVILSCSKERSAGKPVVDETPNGLQALVTTTDGNAISGARVFLRPSTYLHSDTTGQDFLADDSTNSDGIAHFPTVPSGKYRIEAYTAHQVQAATIGIDWNMDTPLSTPLNLVVTPVGFISGTTKPGAIVRIYGSELSTIADASGNYTLTAVPPGECLVRIDTILNSAAAPLSETPVTVVPNDIYTSSNSMSASSSSSIVQPERPSTTIDLDQYVFRFVIPPDPSATQDSLSYFPTPVKLDISQIPDFVNKFAEVRAMAMNGDSYPSALDEISADSNTAFIWILNQNTHPISGDTLFLIFGGHTYTPIPAGNVFSSYNTYFTDPTLDFGYSGAWHFAPAAVLADAGELGYQSLSLDSGTSVDANGVVGSARYFNGQAKIRLPAAERFSADTLTLSCWIKPDAGVNVSSYILSNSNAYELKYLTSSLYFYVQLLTGAGQGTEALPFEDGWTLVSATLSLLNGMKFYSNATDDGVGYFTEDNLEYPNPLAPLVIGNNLAGNQGFRGSIDECRISDIELSQERFRHEVWTHHPSRIVTGTPFLRSEVPFFIMNL